MRAQELNVCLGLILADFQQNMLRDTRTELAFAQITELEREYQRLLQEVWDLPWDTGTASVGHRTSLRPVQSRTSKFCWVSRTKMFDRTAIFRK